MTFSPRPRPVRTGPEGRSQAILRGRFLLTKAWPPDGTGDSLQDRRQWYVIFDSMTTEEVCTPVCGRLCGKTRPEGWAVSVLFVCSLSTFGFALHMLVYLLCDEQLLPLLCDMTKEMALVRAWWGGGSSCGMGAFLSFILGCYTIILSLSIWVKRPRRETQATLSRLGSLHLIAVLLAAWSCLYVNVWVMNIVLSTVGGWSRWQAWDGIYWSIEELWPTVLPALSVLLLGRRIPDYFRMNSWYIQICLLAIGLCIINLVGFIYFFLR